MAYQFEPEQPYADPPHSEQPNAGSEQAGQPYADPQLVHDSLSDTGSAQPSTTRFPLILIGALVAAATVTAITTIGFAAFLNDSPTELETATDPEVVTKLEAAKEECAPTTTAVWLGDDGRSMTIDRVAAEEDPGADLAELGCVLLSIDIPDAVIAQMDSTRALDGRQQANWDGFTASWTYHPDDGLNIILQETD